MIDIRVWDYRVAQLIRTVDGDTYDLLLHKKMDFGFRLTEDKYWGTRFRLLGVDTPETNEVNGSAATQFADNWIKEAVLADVCRGQTYKTDNFGRWLIDLYRADTGEHLAQALTEAGLIE
jgi:endonuclease YncB( thermonuclease family)